MRTLFINGTSCISPQPTFDNSVFLREVKEHTDNKMYCIEPDYTSYFDAVAIRRMSRLMKFGTAAGLRALEDAGIKVPGAISTGTGFGLIDVSQKFLTSVIESNETIVSPTSFIQSTHNTISSNIALMCGCHAHNNTFSHKGFSFESALNDAVLLSAEGVENILVGAYDEVNEYRYDYMRYMGQLRTQPCSNLDVYSKSNPGVIFGEGAAFFLLNAQPGSNCYGAYLGNHTFYKPDNTKEIERQIESFANANNLQLTDVDIVITGISGEAAADSVKQQLHNTLFPEQTLLVYKHLCGEYMTSSAFAFWLAARIMQTQTIPLQLVLENRNRIPKTILLYNSHQVNHSLMLFRAC